MLNFDSYIFEKSTYYDQLHLKMNVNDFFYKKLRHIAYFRKKGHILYEFNF